MRDESKTNEQRVVQLTTEFADQILLCANLDDLYRRVVTLLHQFGYYHVQLLRYDPAAETLVSVATHDQAGIQKLADDHRVPIGRGLIGQAAATGLSILCSDLTQNSNRQATPSLPQAGGELAVPIKLSKQNADAQSKGLRYFIHSGMDGFALFPLDRAIIAPLAKQALDKGMRVVTYISSLGQENQTASVAAVGYDVGHWLGVQAGEWAKKNIPAGKTMKVGVLSFRPLLVQREEGIIAGLGETFDGNVEYVGKESANDAARALPIAEGWLRTHPDLNMIVAINDAGALGAYQAVLAAEKDDPALFFVGGIDATNEALAAIKAGGAFQATIDQKPRETGRQAVRTLVAAIAGRPYPPVTTIECSLVNRNNIDEFLASRGTTRVVEMGEEDKHLAEMNLGQIKIGLNVRTLTNPYFVAVLEGAREEAGRLRVELVVSDSRPVLGVVDIRSDTAGSLDGEDQLMLEGLCSITAVAIEKLAAENERRQAEEELRQAEEKHRNMFESAIEGIFQSTPDGRYLSVNPAMARIYGYESPEEMIASVSDIGHQLCVDPSTRATLERVLEEQDAIRGYEAENYRKDGSKMWTSADTRAVRDANGALLYYEGFLQDITERKRAVETLRLQATRLQIAAEVARVVTSILDIDQVLPRVVDLIRERFGYYQVAVFLIDEPSQWAVLRAASGAAAERVKDGVRLPVGGHSIVGYVTKSGQQYIAQDVTTDPLHLPEPRLPATHAEAVIPLLVGDAVIGALDIESTQPNAFPPDAVLILTTMADQIAVAVQNAKLHAAEKKRARDLDEAYRALRENQERLLISEKMASLGRLTAGIAHEMNTPVAAVRAALTNLDRLAAEYDASIADAEITPAEHQEIAQEMRQSLALAHRAAERAAAFVRSIRSQTRDLATAERQRFNAVPVVRDTLMILNHAAHSGNCEIIFEPSTENVELYGASGQLDQVITNLVTNAIDACRPSQRGTITLHLMPRENDIELQVSDNGCGIAPEIMPRIFDPMFTTKPFGEGTGLGLTIVHDIVVGRFGGSIHVASQPGQGTVFTLHFPKP